MNESVVERSALEYLAGAAAVIAAANRSGRVTWRLKDGRTCAEWQESQVAAGEKSPAGPLAL